MFCSLLGIPSNLTFPLFMKGFLGVMVEFLGKLWMGGIFFLVITINTYLLIFNVKDFLQQIQGCTTNAQILIIYCTAVIWSVYYTEFSVSWCLTACCTTWNEIPQRLSNESTICESHPTKISVPHRYKKICACTVYCSIFTVGHITVGGSICMQMLTRSGWSPSNDIEVPTYIRIICIKYWL